MEDDVHAGSSSRTAGDKDVCSFRLGIRKKVLSQKIKMMLPPRRYSYRSAPVFNSAKTMLRSRLGRASISSPHVCIICRSFRQYAPRPTECSKLKAGKYETGEVGKDLDVNQRRKSRKNEAISVPPTIAYGPAEEPVESTSLTKSNTERRVSSKLVRSLKEAMQARSLAKSPKKLKRAAKTPKDKNTEEAEDGTKMKRMRSGSRKLHQKKKESSDSSTEGTVESIDAKMLNFEALPIAPSQVPSLAHELDRVLFNPGVYYLQDPRTQVYNFDPYLQKIMPVAEFNFNALRQYVTSSQDATLAKIASEHGKKYVGSTSSMTSVLAHFHFLLSAWRKIDTGMMSKSFPENSQSFTTIQQSPSAVFLRWNPETETYAIDADKQFDEGNILAMLGRSMEKLVTLPKEEFELYRKSHSGPDAKTEDDGKLESFHYSTLGDFLMRSQLDAHDDRLPGTGMFDLKTRAVLSVRMNTQDYEQSTGYEIKHGLGQWESFEREYYDMLRSTALKYSLQVRMGRMDGIFVAYHNILRIFGFQYISLPELDKALHGQNDLALGDQEFRHSLALLNKVFDRAIEKFPKQSIRFHVETRPTAVPFMYVFAEPMTEDQIDSIQNSNQAKIEAFESSIMGLQTDSNDTKEGIEQDWEVIRALVEEEMAEDEFRDDDGDSENELYARLSEFAEHISKKKQELEEILAEFTDNADADDREVKGLTVESAEVETGLSRLQEIADQFTYKTQNFRQKLKNHEADNPELGEVISQLDDIIEQVQGDNTRYTLESIQDNDSADDVPEDDPEAIQVEETIRTTDAEFEEEAGAKERDQTDSLPAEIEGDSMPDSSQTEVAPPEATSGEETDNLADEVQEGETDESALDEERGPLLAMSLAIRNKVNNYYVDRPVDLASSDDWQVEYSFTEIEDPVRAWRFYQQVQRRRATRLDRKKEKYVDSFRASLANISDNTREWRRMKDALEQDAPRVVFEPVAGRGSDIGTSNAETVATKGNDLGDEKQIGDVDDYLSWLYKK